jgi:hypothetical protein
MGAVCNTHMGDTVCKIVVERPGGNRPFWKHRSRPIWEDIKMGARVWTGFMLLFFEDLVTF